MRWSVRLDGVLSRGTERLREPILWPAWFVVDDTALRFLVGDVTAVDFVHAPGPVAQQDAGGPAGWERAISSSGLPRERVLVGMGLILSSGTTKQTEQAYEDLVRRLQALVLLRAAQASGLGALLAAFGGSLTGPDPKEDEEQLGRLRKGIDPAELDLASDLVDSLGAFQAAGRLLAEVSPGSSLSTAQPVAALASARDVLRPERMLPEPGSVVAASVQAWRPQDLKKGEPLAFRRNLPALAVSRASLTLSGSLRLED